MILVSSIVGEPEEEPALGGPVSFMQYRSVWTFHHPAEGPTKSLMIINCYALDFTIDFSLHLIYCFTQLPSQSTFSQDSELAVFAQKLKRDSVKLKTSNN